jgi:hypothetical protein
VLLKTRPSQNANVVGHLRDHTIHISDGEQYEVYLVDIAAANDGYYEGKVKHGGGSVDEGMYDYDVRNFHQDSRWFPRNIPETDVSSDGTTKSREEDSKIESRNELIARTHKL